ncbi:MAG: hypothetical protein INH41_26400 [Myxococcaceae bacterium]|nr:hypothetical protein [Myxococcaceae bacterium]MCA3015931.1 hypothetical protein [Myxococcaceae bacterium]
MTRAVAPTRWLFSPAVDVSVFAGSALGAALVVLLARASGLTGDTPLWAWLVFVLGIDVAHVWATLYRAYFDRAELARRPLLYAAAPLLAFGLSVSAHAVSPAFFWRCLAYVAVWHFIRQQVGWMTLYGRREGVDDVTLRLDRLAMWAVTLGPVVWWHARLPRPFWWFREHDFVGGLPRVVGDVALALHAAALVAWVGRAAVRRVKGAPLPVARAVLLAATWVTWFGGVVLAQDDFTFTVMNVTLHGVPYLALLWRYARGRQAERGYGAVGALVRFGLPAFIGALLLLAFAEEFLWDTLVWHERPQVFGEGGLDLGPAALSLVVPLLSLPQTTHYVLDGFVWRTRDDPSLAPRLGWA